MDRGYFDETFISSLIGIPGKTINNWKCRFGYNYQQNEHNQSTYLAVHHCNNYKLQIKFSFVRTQTCWHNYIGIVTSLDFEVRETKVVNGTFCHS